MESQAVIGLRLAKLAWGDAAAQAEARRMVAEKLTAVIDIQQRVGAAALFGKAQPTPDDIVRLYRRRVRSNKRRLTRKK
jgi:hypothetical protein